MEVLIYCSQCEAKTPHETDAIQINEYESMLIFKCQTCDNGRSQIVENHRIKHTLKLKKDEQKNTTKDGSHQK